MAPSLVNFLDGTGFMYFLRFFEILMLDRATLHREIGRQGTMSVSLDLSLVGAAIGISFISWRSKKTLMTRQIG